MKIIFPELENPVIAQAVQGFPNLEPVLARGLSEAGEMLKNGLADSMIAGLDFPSRDVILAFKNYVPLESNYFSSFFVCKRDNYQIFVADGGVIKDPSRDQLYTITEDTAKSFIAYTGQTPKIAMLSYSTKGSGGEGDPSVEKILNVVTKIQQNHPDWLIDGQIFRIHAEDIVILSNVCKRNIHEVLDGTLVYEMFDFYPSVFNHSSQWKIFFTKHHIIARDRDPSAASIYTYLDLLRQEMNAEVEPLGCRESIRMLLNLTATEFCRRAFRFSL